MHIISSFIFALTANIDNFTVGIAYGVKNIRIALKSNTLIAAITGIGTFMSMAIGYIINRFLPSNISNILGASILICKTKNTPNHSISLRIWGITMHVFEIQF